MKLILSTNPSSTPITPAWLAVLNEFIGAASTQAHAPGPVVMDALIHDAETRKQVRSLCDAAKIDHAFIADDLQLTDFKLVVMDMDSTLITIECIDEIADLCGLKAEVSAITEATMRGEIKNFSESLQRRVALLEGLDGVALEKVYDERLHLSPGADTMLAAVRKAGLKTLLVSGGFTFFTERLQRRLGLDFTLANTLEIAGGIPTGKLTGKVLGTIVDADEKARMVERTCAQLGISTHQAIVIGDGANDLKMMAHAGLSIAYHAKPVVRAQTMQAIDHGGLDVLLDWFQSA